jgi:heme/copper-type cytochrome/quinol oxidase subunit 4
MNNKQNESGFITMIVVIVVLVVLIIGSAWIRVKKAQKAKVGVVFSLVSGTIHG